MDLREHGDHIVSHSHEEGDQTKSDLHQEKITHPGCGEHADDTSVPQEAPDEEATSGPQESSGKDENVGENRDPDDRHPAEDWSSDEEPPDEISLELWYKIRDMVSRCVEAGILDATVFPPLKIGPQSAKCMLKFTREDYDLQPFPLAPRADLMITRGGAVSSAYSCFAEEEDMSLIELSGYYSDVVQEGVSHGKRYAIDILDKGEIYLRMKKHARYFTRAIRRFKQVQGFFERAKAISVPKRVALLAAKQSGEDLREFSNLCALGLSQHVDTKLKMPTLADLAATVFPVRLSTLEVNLAGYTLSKVTGSIYHATPDPESKLKLSVVQYGHIRIAGTTAIS